MFIVSVIPLKKGLQKEELSYFTSEHVMPGMIVHIPVRKKIISAIVVDIESVANKKSDIKNADFNLKKITEIVGPSPFSNELFETLYELKDYYVTWTCTLINLVVPVFMFNSYEQLSHSETPRVVKNSSIAQEKLIYQGGLDDRLSYYKTYIRGAFAKKESVFIVLPTIHEVEFIAETLRKGIETYTFVLHSGISEKELIMLYNQIVDEPHPILVIATAGFLAIPRNDIATIIVEHESSSAYKTIARPYVDLRTVIEIFSKKIGVKLIFGDTLLRTETLWRHSNHEFGEVYPVSFRKTHEVEIEVRDMREEKETVGGETQVAILSTEAKNIIESLDKKRGHVFLFTLKKGLASITECNDCKRAVTCPKCKNPLTLRSQSKKGRVFFCTTCKETTDAFSRCTYCGSWNMTALGIGTERVMELLHKLYADLPVFLFDKDIIKNESTAQKIINAFYEEKSAVIVGTEFALFYFDKKMDYTIITSFDSFFSIPNFRINERIIGLISSLVSYTEKKLIIQTRNPDEKILQSILVGNFSDWYKREIMDREKFNYPPFTTLIKVSAAGNGETLERAKAYCAETFAEWNPIILDTKSHVPGYDAMSMILKVPRGEWSPIGLFGDATLDPELLSALRSLPNRWAIIVDPYDLN